MSERRPRMQVVRGLPGSGKTTLANREWPGLLKLELDQYCSRGGRYDWNEESNALAKKWLTDTVKLVTGTGMDFVLCGVFAGNAEDLPALARIALFSGYDVYVTTMPERRFGSDVHGVREGDYRAMKEGFKSDAAVCQELMELSEGSGGSVFCNWQMKEYVK